MLQKTIKAYIENQINHQPQNQSIGIYKQEKEYAEAHGLVPEQIKLVEEKAQSRFKDAYLERVDKETEELISAENPTEFLQEKVNFLKANQKEFVYLESDWFDIIKIDGLTLEHDDVFGTYKGLLGLKQKKAAGSSIRNWFNEKANGETKKFQLLFNDKDGLWDVNFDCDLIEGFHGDLTLNEAFEMIYSFLFELVKDLESTVQ
ncbi:hypothetical protein RFW18_07260 [Metabacillus idriensis]|uniref:hypothetical protein n=1 Tax=Metabacillus idriensis TaxID=324768 RepID=UPI0028140911|nr:hypothetical protein [Metabacillus idriensis]MDR0137545.1 hypothetical protein [Metabacillus idriensis]